MNENFRDCYIFFRDYHSTAAPLWAIVGVKKDGMILFSGDE